MTELREFKQTFSKSQEKVGELLEKNSDDQRKRRDDEAYIRSRLTQGDLSAKSRELLNAQLEHICGGRAQ